MDRYKLGDIDNERFYLLPKGLFLNPEYKGLTVISKVVYALLRDRMKLSQVNKWADENGEIFLLFTQGEIQKALGISHPTCVKSMKQLQQYGLIDIVRQGIQKPNKVYIRKLKNFTSESKKILLQEVKNFNTNDTDISDTDINDTERYTETRKQGTHNFEKPTVEEINDYCLERENDVDPEAFFDFYESKGWKVGRNPMKDWKAAVRNWERNDYGQHKKKKKKKSQYDEIDF